MTGFRDHRARPILNRRRGEYHDARQSPVDYGDSEVLNDQPMFGSGFPPAATAKRSTCSPLPERRGTPRIGGIASSFRSSAGSQPITRSVVSLMGPGAKAGEAGWILEADFPTLEDAMTALDAEDFQDVKAATETLASTIFLFEVREV